MFTYTYRIEIGKLFLHKEGSQLILHPSHYTEFKREEIKEILYWLGDVNYKVIEIERVHNTKERIVYLASEIKELFGWEKE